MKQMSYWLSPIYNIEPFTIGKEKVEITEKDALELRKLFQTLHPFFLPFLKTHILPKGEDDDLVCGVEKFNLPKGEDIIFNGNPLELSKCGRAFLNKLPTLQEIEERRNTFKDKIKEITKEFPDYLSLVTEWWNKGYIVVIFKE